MRYFRRAAAAAAILLLSVWLLQSFFAHRHGLPDGVSCRALLPLRITCEERLPAPAACPEAEPGDIWITFSTHTLGWRHGHAALAVGPQTLLEAAMPGVPSGYSTTESWSTYPTLLILRVKGASPQTRTDAAQRAAACLCDVPYGFFSGFGDTKAPPPPLTQVQCAYLPWYAWALQGFDLDSDGGRLVTVADLAECPQLEIVAHRGIEHLPGAKEKTEPAG